MIALLADSIQLFSHTSDTIKTKITQLMQKSTKKPTSIFLSPGTEDSPEQVEIFRFGFVLLLRHSKWISAAMEGFGITDIYHIPTFHPRVLSDNEWKALKSSDMVVLAGGSPTIIWDRFRQCGLLQFLVESIRDRCRVFLGISGGAMVLGAFPSDFQHSPIPQTVQWWGLGAVPFICSPHEADPSWPELRAMADAFSMPSTNVEAPLQAWLPMALMMAPVLRPVQCGEIVTRWTPLAIPHGAALLVERTAERATTATSVTVRKIDVLHEPPLFLDRSASVSE